MFHVLKNISKGRINVKGIKIPAGESVEIPQKKYNLIKGTVIAFKKQGVLITTVKNEATKEGEAPVVNTNADSNDESNENSNDESGETKPDENTDSNDESGETKPDENTDSNDESGDDEVPTENVETVTEVKPHGQSRRRR